jgi:LPS sulfotransferase NodH
MLWKGMDMQKSSSEWQRVTIEQHSSRSFPVFVDGRSTVLVVGHERSGNHFVMNTLAACYGHVSRPWVDLDYQTFNINYFKSMRVAEVLTHLGTKKVASVVKSHHQLDFFKDRIENILSVLKIIYIYRNPVDMMISFWKLLHSFSWVEGPRVEDPLCLARCQPSGQLMRYQMQQYPSMVHRWAAHVSQWLELADSSERVAAIAYEDLDQNFGATVTALADFMEREPQQIKRPSRTEATIKPEPLPQWVRQHQPAREALSACCLETAGVLMKELGYSRPELGEN